MGKWRDRYLIGVKCLSIDENGKQLGLVNDECGTQAFWMVAAEAFDEAQKPLQARYAKFVNLTSGLPLKAYKDVANVEVLDKQTYKWPMSQPMELYGGGAILKIIPAIKIEKMELVIRLSRKNMGKPLDFRFECGDPERPTELFNSKQHEMGTNDRMPTADVHVVLPDGVPEIRLINNSGKDCGIMIEKFVFLDQL